MYTKDNILGLDIKSGGTAYYIKSIQATQVIIGKRNDDWIADYNLAQALKHINSGAWIIIPSEKPEQSLEIEALLIN